MFGVRSIPNTERAGLGRSQAEVAAGGVTQSINGADVALDEDVDAPVASLSGDPFDANAGQRGAGGVAGAQRVSGDPGGGQTGGSGAGTKDPSDGVTGDRLQSGTAGAHAGEQRARGGAAEVQPGGERGDGVGGPMPAGGDADDLAAAGGVGLGAADGDQQAGWLGLEVGEGEGGELAAAQRGGVPEQDERGVAGARRGGAVVRSMQATMARISATVSGRAWRMGAVPRLRRSPRRTRPTVWWVVGSATPARGAGTRSRSR